MVFRTTLISLLFFISVFTEASDSCVKSSQLNGIWILNNVIQSGVERPPMNPDIKLTYTFNKDNTSRLYWFNKNNPDEFCERKGIYSYNNRYIHDETTWVNPENALDCQRDPDMQMGKYTQTLAPILKGRLMLHIPVSETVVIYVFDQVPSL